jgi:hypothetical protein
MGLPRRIGLRGWIVPRRGAAFEAAFAVAQDKQGVGVLRPTKGKTESRGKKREDERKAEFAWLPVSLIINPDPVTGLKTLFVRAIVRNQ